MDIVGWDEHYESFHAKLLDVQPSVDNGRVEDDERQEDGDMENDNPFLVQSESQIHEVGVGENTGPNHKDHHDKAITDFVDIIKVARAQHLYLRKKCVEQCGSNPLPSVLSDTLTSVAVPFFQIIGMTIRFYILWRYICDMAVGVRGSPDEGLRLCLLFVLSQFVFRWAMAEFIESDRLREQPGHTQSEAHER
ncbi:hypothetical protein BC937DRAFT_87153 [Endogone sp. FLAS-F59071]|nr:hypothetical protein BC937DRAFT_87153 [Endogone sp. FLAS-F59071]|eukprot:RUS19652.1 hypothetical protein BC937DRAFT_87153 [Endogone sp. FLAS-F59071]